MPKSISLVVIAASLALMGQAAPSSAKDGRNGAFIGGAAAGVVGGVLLNEALQNREPDVIVEERRVQARPVYVDPQFDRLQELRDRCDDGNRRACIRFGMILGRNAAREKSWRRARPDLYTWDRD